MISVLNQFKIYLTRKPLQHAFIHVMKFYSPAVSIIKKIARSHKIVMAVGAGGLEIPPGLVPRGASLSAVSASSAQRPFFAPHSPRQTH